MIVQCHALVEDASAKLNIEPDNMFLLAVMERNHQGHEMVPVERYAATLHDIWLNKNGIPDWLEDFLLDVVIGKYPLAPQVD